MSFGVIGDGGSAFVVWGLAIPYAKLKTVPNISINTLNLRSRNKLGGVLLVVLVRYVVSCLCIILYSWFGTVIMEFFISALLIVINSISLSRVAMSFTLLPSGAL